MMDSISDLEEGSPFFDALEQISPTFDCICVDGCPGYKDWEYDVWISSPQSIDERRSKFVQWMGLNESGLEGGDSVDICDNSEDGCVFKVNVGRVMQNSGAVLRTSGVEDEFSSSRSSLSSCSTDDLDLFSGVDLIEGRICCGISDGGSGDQWGGNKRLEKIQDTNSQVPIYRESKDDSKSPKSVQQLVQRELEGNGNATRTMNRSKDRWFSRLRSLACMMSMNMRNGTVESNNLSQVRERGAQRVGVRNYRRRLKELSALFVGQDFQAHEGSILAMKFSPDGQYLASAGEDKLVRVWQVVEDERSDTFDIADVDPSCMYFSVNHLSELGPLTAQNDSVNKSKNLKKISDSACIIFPPKVFRILEKPLHVFQGHKGEILDLSWSKNDCLLSSSVDKTVRLWRVGLDQCLKVFSHSDYVTCIQFNPVNDDNFISGSIDGIVRIWAIDDCQVVDWTKTRDTITAISFRPDGKAGVVGSITGMCFFFDLSDNHLRLESQMCLNTKKKLSPCKRITGFQFLLQDPSNILVTSADSRIRIINGMDIIAKYKGLQSAGNHNSASFTSDGKHIISACDDSNVYIWNYVGQKDTKAIYKSFECFSSDASVALTWPGSRIVTSGETLKTKQPPDSSIQSLPLSPSTHFSLCQDFILDSGSKGSATWPEEKLPASNLNRGAYTCSMSKSQHKLFRTSCQSLMSSHAWGLVIVTGDWEGRIRSFYNYGLPAPV